MTKPRKLQWTVLVLAGAASFAIGVIVAVRTLTTGPEAANANGALEGPTRRPDAEALAEMQELVGVASDYINAERFSEAEKLLDDLHSKYPEEESVKATRAELYIHQVRYEDAYAATRELIELNDQQPEYRFNAAVLAGMLDRHDEASVHYQEASRLDPSNPKYPLYFAQTLIKLHEYDAAAARLLQVIHLDKSIHEAYGTLGEIYLIQNKLDLAERQIERARQLAPEHLKWRLAEARLLRRRHRPQDAITLLNALEAPERFHQEVVNEIGQSWALLGAPAKASQVHVDHLQAAPESTESAIRAAQYLMVVGDRDEARRWTSYAERLDPDDERVNQLRAQLSEG
ncbi:MAG: tetratricopeptide repeat protein [Phycisphaerales bacterium]